MKRQLANAITGLRAACGVALLFCAPLTHLFYAFYAVGGISDALDGFVARKTGSQSPRGAQFDTAADAIFFFCTALSLLPVLSLPPWVWIWGAGVAFCKLCNAVFYLWTHHALPNTHTFANKTAGVLLFCAPFLMPIVGWAFLCALLCALATAAAISETVTLFSRPAEKEAPRAQTSPD